MFPSSGGRTDPGGGFGRGRGVRPPPVSRSRTRPAPTPLCSVLPCFQEPGEQDPAAFPAVSSIPGVVRSRCGCWEALRSAACAISIPGPASSSPVIVYLLRANHKACRAYPGKKKQLRTDIFMEIMKQAISERICRRLGGNPSAAGAPAAPARRRGRGGRDPQPRPRRRCWCPPAPFTPKCSLWSRLPAPASPLLCPGER